MFQGYTALQLQFMEHVMQFPMLNVLHFNISTSRSLCAVPNLAVSCSSLISCFSGMLLRYCASDCEMVPVAPIINGSKFVLTCHHHHHHHHH